MRNRFPALGLLLLSLTGPTASAQTVVISDPLQGATTGQAVGGTFAANGFRPGKGSGHILYTLPQTVKEGYVEFEITGFGQEMRPTGRPDLGEFEHGLFAMYDGRDLPPEPVPYFICYRENHYRFALASFLDTRELQPFLVVAKPERASSPLPVFTDELKTDDPATTVCKTKGLGTRDFSKRGKTAPVSFDPARWHRFRVEWKARTFSVSVDGASLWQTSYPYDYAPKQHRIWLGSIPGYETKYVSFSDTITFRNFRLVSHQPVQVLGTAEDAGTRDANSPPAPTSEVKPDAGSLVSDPRPAPAVSPSMDAARPRDASRPTETTAPATSPRSSGRCALGAGEALSIAGASLALLLLARTVRRRRG